jgi:hypothetical protein
MMVYFLGLVARESNGVRLDDGSLVGKTVRRISVWERSPDCGNLPGETLAAEREITPLARVTGWALLSFI